MKKLFLPFLLLLSAIPLHAKIPFLYEGAGPAGMGRAYIAVEGDEYSIFYNPAGLERMQVRVLSTGFEFYEKNMQEDGQKYGYLSVLNSLTFAMKNFGMSVRYSGYGLHDSIILGPPSENYYQQFEVKLAYAFKLDYPLSGGVVLKYLYLDPEPGMDMNRFNRFTYTAGLQYHLGNQLCIGFMMNGVHLGDAGTALWNDFRYIGEVNPEPDYNVSVGLSYKITDKLLIAADVKNVFEPGNVVSGISDNADHADISNLKREYNFGVKYEMGKGITIETGFYIDQPNVKIEGYMGDEFSGVEYNTSLGISYANRNWKADTAVIYTLNEGPHQTAALFWCLNLGMMFKNY